MRRSEPKPKNVYLPAPDVQSVARDLIKTYHQHLTNVDVRCYFQTRASKKAGKTLFCVSRKVGNLNAFLAGKDCDEDNGVGEIFAIVVYRRAWEMLDEAKRTALIDHELSHCVLTDKGKIAIAQHDLEEFFAVVSRHGMYRKEIEEFVAFARRKADRPELPLDEPDVPKTNGHVAPSVVASIDVPAPEPIEEEDGLSLNDDWPSDFRVELEDGTAVGVLLSAEGKGWYSFTMAGAINEKCTLAKKARKSEIADDPEGYALKVAQEARNRYVATFAVRGEAL